MNSWQKNFIFLSQIIGIPVIDINTNARIGYVFDVIANLKEMYPKINALVYKTNSKRKKMYMPWKHVKKIVENKAIFVENVAHSLHDVQIAESDIFLKDTFWDKQIVDIAGSKVVRVNDLHLLKEDMKLWMVHVDIGFTGLIRRLGWTRFITFCLQLLASYELTDRLISWKFVQPIASSIGSNAIALKVHQSKLSELHPADLADIFVDLGNEERIAILKSLDNATAAHTFQELPLKIRVQIAELLEMDKLLSIINEMAMDELVDLLSKLPKKKIHIIFSKMPHEKVTQINSLLGHSERIAGSIMNTEYIAVKQGAAVSEVIDKIKKEAKKKESIYYIYVLDNNDTLAGAITLRQLLTMPPEKPVFEFMRRRVAKVRVDTDVKDVAEIFYKYDFTVVPVIDRQNKLQGIITIKDAFESVFREIREETEEVK